MNSIPHPVGLDNVHKVHHCDRPIERVAGGCCASSLTPASYCGKTLHCTLCPQSAEYTANDVDVIPSWSSACLSHKIFCKPAGKFFLQNCTRFFDYHTRQYSALQVHFLHSQNLHEDFSAKTQRVQNAYITIFYTIITTTETSRDVTDCWEDHFFHSPFSSFLAALCRKRAVFFCLFSYKKRTVPETSGKPCAFLSALNYIGLRLNCGLGVKSGARKTKQRACGTVRIPEEQ